MRGAGFEPANPLRDEILSYAIIFHQNSKYNARAFFCPHSDQSRWPSFFSKGLFFLWRKKSLDLATLALNRRNLRFLQFQALSDSSYWNILFGKSFVKTSSLYPFPLSYLKIKRTSDLKNYFKSCKSLLNCCNCFCNPSNDSPTCLISLSS